MEMDSRVQWAHLLPELLSRIAKRLENGTAIRQFRAVCRSWRSSCCLPPNLLSLHPPPKFPSINGPFESESDPHDLAIISSSIYLLVPCQDQRLSTHPIPWLVRLQESNPGKLKLRSPLMPCILPLPNNIDLSEFRVIELAKSYHFTRRRVSDEAIIKVVLLSNPKSKDFAALMLSGNGEVFAVRSTSEGWEPIKFDEASSVDDILSFRGDVYAVDNRGCLYRISKTLEANIVSVPVRGHHYREKRKHLVELNRELYLVREINFNVEVYKLDERKCSWYSIDSFGDRILFVATDCCFFVSAEVFPSWKGNGIVYHTGSFCLKFGKNYPDLSWDDSGIPFRSWGIAHYVRLGDERHWRFLMFDSMVKDVLMSPPDEWFSS